ncbi:hypothetical protein [Chryseobacterium sp.]|uniref:hypothetical protein n=1 Tax=Chryseobacterium sp. TaxID=1871047 RepID=UPI002FCA066F
MKNGFLSIIFYSIFIVFVGFSIFVGFDVLDSGYILSLSKKINDGEVIYKDFDYVRPFGTPVFWALILKPFYGIQNHFFILCRIFVLLQFFIIAYNISRVFFKCDSWDRRMFLSIPLLAMLNINIFPIMPWHTIDGVFLLSFSLYYLHKKNILLAFLFSLFAASTKQSFFLLPILVLAFSVFFKNQINLKCNIKLGILTLISLCLILYYKIPEGISYYESGTEGKNQNMLYLVGIKMYLNSYKYFFPFFISLIISSVLWFTKKITAFFEVTLLFILLLSFSIPFYHWLYDIIAKRDASNYTILSSINGLLPLCMFYQIIQFFRTKNTQEKYSISIGLFAVMIAWSSSISWGANNILLALPFLLINTDSNTLFDKKYIPILISLLLFTLRIINPYMEKNFTESTFSKIVNTPIYSGIYTNTKNIIFLNESKEITKKYKDVIFLPGFPAASFMFEKTKNRMPWEMNVEYVNYKKDLSLLQKKNLYFILEKKSFEDDSSSFYGSKFTDIVKAKRVIIDSTSNFYIYK